MEDGEAPGELHVSCEVAPSEALAWMAGILRTLLDASVQTGQPMYWT